MKNRTILPCVITVTNDETEIFMEMAVNNFKKHLQVMIDCMGDDYERHFKDRRYVEDVIVKVIERTKQDFSESMKDNKGKECYLFLDEVRRNLRVIYTAYRTNY
ncbi:TPA: hypothetical protein ACYRSE_004997 [Klebsiella michiganensis]|uniref:hypothetical protein n=1 Tax=Klebsiella TaxID=570 RepID=UPI000BA10942|nr:MULTISPECIES: hypothetical protein [Klebsiella]KAB5488703.1 hypothetical protein F8562_25005 [Klebsiella sp. RCJ4]MBZ7145951.1 hypothetical protein [Klebsiella michiganensis]OZS21488.1 hypothetical protein CIG57_27615 [Klebsiella michiganensis]HBK4614383.1 hypothetical protein [Klebsiella michiganensis]HBM3200165.1 hypothetical protein [Klebsiella michiganensis]